LAWDADGTVFGQFPSPSGIWTDRQANAAELNDEDDVTVNIKPVGSDLGYGAWVWPEARDLKGYFMATRTLDFTFSGGEVQRTEYSQDTTNGIDGTWTTIENNAPNPIPSLVTSVSWNYRLLIHSFDAPNTRGFRYLGHHGEVGPDRHRKAFHLYGLISSGSTPDRLLYIDDSTGLEFVEPLDWGDVPRGTTLDYDIKVKNNSATLTAATNLLDFEALYQSSDTWYTIKETGGSFAATLAIASIAAGVTYPTGGNVITIRLTVADAAALGLQAARLKLSTTTWS
jgi:hypothetical protein